MHTYVHIYTYIYVTRAHSATNTCLVRRRVGGGPRHTRYAPRLPRLPILWFSVFELLFKGWELSLWGSRLGHLLLGPDARRRQHGGWDEAGAQRNRHDMQHIITTSQALWRFQNRAVITRGLAQPRVEVFMSVRDCIHHMVMTMQLNSCVLVGILVIRLCATMFERF